MTRLVNILFTVAALSQSLVAADFKNTLKERLKEEVFYVTYADGFGGVPKGYRWEHTYVVRPDKSVALKKVWGVGERAMGTIDPDILVKIRAVNIKKNKIEMTVRTADPQDLPQGLLDKVTGAQFSQQLEVNLIFEVGKEAIADEDYATINEFIRVLMLSSSDKAASEEAAMEAVAERRNAARQRRENQQRVEEPTID